MGRKQCPECYAQHEDSVMACDCGYRFAMKGRRQLSPFGPRCPECRGRKVNLIDRWGRGTRAKVDYQCQECRAVFSRRDLAKALRWFLVEALFG